MVYVKVCGLCRTQDAALAADAGADYLGVVLAPGRSRSQSVSQAGEILAAGGACRRVGIFVDAGLEELVEAGSRLGLAALQLHGTESPERATAARNAGPWQVWKALRPRSGAEFLEHAQRYGAAADALLVDGWSERGPGGTGTRFPWAEVAAARPRIPPGLHLVVAGGLRPDNVAAAIARLAPDVVDVSSGVERTIGEKDPALVRAFIDGARAASPEYVPAGSASRSLQSSGK